MKQTTASDDDKVLVSRRDWLRLTALAAGSVAAGSVINPETTLASTDSDTFPFVAGWAAITARLDLFTELNSQTEFQVAESLNLNLTGWRAALNFWAGNSVPVGTCSVKMIDVLQAVATPPASSVNNIFAAGLKAYGGYTGGGCPRLPQLVTIGNL